MTYNFLIARGFIISAMLQPLMSSSNQLHYFWFTIDVYKFISIKPASVSCAFCFVFYYILILSLDIADDKDKLKSSEQLDEELREVIKRIWKRTSPRLLDQIIPPKGKSH